MQQIKTKKNITITDHNGKKDKQERHIVKSDSKPCNIYKWSRNHGIITNYICIKDDNEPWRGINLYISGNYSICTISICLR